ncbi:hypothetical protein Pst134EB_026135 [Puccinia striiformis f. sp. tritici]|nr:hypothetical protein Pst134EB_026135 [Puccinia striiformis f. sp. tritici]
MFVKTSVLVVYGALAELVTATTAAYHSVRLTRRMESAVVKGELESKSAKEIKIFTHPELDSHAAEPGELGLTLMQFCTRGGREMDVESKDMERFLNAFVSSYMRHEYATKRFTIQDLYRDHLEWLHLHHKTHTKIVEASEVLSNKMDGTLERYTLLPLFRKNKLRECKFPFEVLMVGSKSESGVKISLQDYYNNNMNGQILTCREEAGFVHWKLGKEWSSQYMDTERLKISDLLQGYMEWAKEDSILKDNSYVFGGSNVKDSETYTKLVEGLNRTSWHWKSILCTIKNIWKKLTKLGCKRTPASETNLK